MAYIEIWIKFGIIIYRVDPKENRGGQSKPMEIGFWRMLKEKFMFYYEKLIELDEIEFEEEFKPNHEIKLAYQISRILCDFYHTRVFHTTQDVINIPNSTTAETDIQKLTPDIPELTPDEISVVLKRHYDEHFAQIAILHKSIHHYANQPFYFYFNLGYMREAQDAIKLAFGNMIFAISFCNFFLPINLLPSEKKSSFIEDTKEGRIEILQVPKGEICDEHCINFINGQKNEYIRRFEFSSKID